MLFASIRAERKRAQRRFNPSFGDFHSETVFEKRSLAAPLFTPANSWLVRATAGDAFPEETVEGVDTAVTQYEDDESFTDPVTGLTNLYSAYASVSNVLETVSGPNGASGIHIAVTQSGVQTANISYVNTGEGADAFSTADLDVGDGSGAATWTITDPLNPTNPDAHVTATFMIDYATNSSPANLFLHGTPTLDFVSNQISVFLNVNGIEGLQVWDNTTPGGPTLVHEDTSITSDNPDSFSYTYQVREPITLPGTETIRYTSNLTDFTDTGWGPAPGQYSNQQTLKWGFDLTNN